MPRHHSERREKSHRHHGVSRSPSPGPSRRHGRSYYDTQGAGTRRSPRFEMKLFNQMERMGREISRSVSNVAVRVSSLEKNMTEYIPVHVPRCGHTMQVSPLYRITRETRDRLTKNRIMYNKPILQNQTTSSVKAVNGCGANNLNVEIEGGIESLNDTVPVKPDEVELVSSSSDEGEYTASDNSQKENLEPKTPEFVPAPLGRCDAIAEGFDQWVPVGNNQLATQQGSVQQVSTSADIFGERIPLEEVKTGNDLTTGDDVLAVLGLNGGNIIDTTNALDGNYIEEHVQNIEINLGASNLPGTNATVINYEITPRDMVNDFGAAKTLIATTESNVVGSKDHSKSEILFGEVPEASGKGYSEWKLNLETVVENDIIFEYWLDMRHRVKSEKPKLYLGKFKGKQKLNEMAIPMNSYERMVKSDIYQLVTGKHGGRSSRGASMDGSGPSTSAVEPKNKFAKMANNVD